jgi:hypothetical protein
MCTLPSLLDKYIVNVSKSKVKASNDTIIQTKSLDYHQLVYVLHQFNPDMVLVQADNCEYITISSNNDYNTNSGITYKKYPIHIKQQLNVTELIAISPSQMFDTIVCFNDKKTIFVPVIGERVGLSYSERRLHAMTLVFDTIKHIVFLHDPNSRSLFNNNETMILLKEYIERFNTILQDYGMPCYTFKKYEFDFMNINIKFFFENDITGNCVVASIAFMILYHSIQDASYIEHLLQNTKKDEYKKVYVAIYNKLHEYLGMCK